MRLFILLLIFSFLMPIYAETSSTSEHFLPNGLKVIIKEDHRAPVAILQVWYKVGSSYEPNGITGISHALEHMMFRGTQKHGPGVLKKIIADNGGNINAMTNDDYTMYYEMLSADKLPIAFKLEADRMHGLLLRKKEFKKELQVIMEERRLRTQDNPQSRTYERFAAIAHTSSPYRHPTIGWMSDIRHLTTKDLYRWYVNWYIPNNAILVVVGDVNPKYIYQLAKKYFGHLKKNAIPKLKPQVEQHPLGSRSITVEIPAKLPWLIMGYNVPTLKTAKEKWEPYALEVAAAILDSGNSARLSKQLIRKQQIAIEAFAGYSLYSRLDSLFLLGGTPSPNYTVQQLRNALLHQIEQLQMTLVTQEELNRIENQIVANKIYTKDSIDAQAYEIGSLESIGLSWREADRYIQHIKAVTPEQIRKVAQKYLVPERLTTGILKPIERGK